MQLYDSKRVDSNLFHFLETGKHEKDPPTLKDLKKKYHKPRKEIAPFLNTKSISVIAENVKHSEYEYQLQLNKI